MRTAIIGAGRQGRRRALAIRGSGDEVAQVVDSNERLARALATECHSPASIDWHDAVADRRIDAVVVCTPNDTHARISIAALRAGKHVLCEKPLARNPSEALRVIAEAKRSRAKLKCGFNLRYHPAISGAKKLVDGGRLGKLLVLRCRYGISSREASKRDWRTDPSVAGGGQLMDQGVHVLDLFRWFAGDFSEVVGLASTMYWGISPSEDNAFAILRTRGGSAATLHVSWTEWKNLFSFEVLGEDGYAKVEGLGGSYGVERLLKGRRDLAGPFREEVTEFRGEDRSWAAEWADFSSGTRGSGTFRGSAYDGWAAVRLAYAIYKSSKSREWVNLHWRG